MALFKRKLRVQEAARMALFGALSRDSDKALSGIVGAGALSPEEISRLKVELLPFDIALLHGLFLEHIVARTSEGAFHLGRAFGGALLYAFADAGRLEEASGDQAERLLERALSYIEVVSSVSDDELADKGTFFYYCEEFTRRVLPNIQSRLEADRDRYLQVFHIATQNYQVTKEAFDAFLSTYKLIIE